MLNKHPHLEFWQHEQEAPFIGFDFSYLNGRTLEMSPPWDYDALARKALTGAASALDLGTAGGERLLQWREVFPRRLVVTEGYPPNLALARQRLEPLGVTVLEAETSLNVVLPLPDASFDLILCRHSAYNIADVERLLKPGGHFLTQQVDGRNLADLSACFDAVQPWTDFTLNFALEKLQSESDLHLERAEAWNGQTRFLDVGAIVYFLKAIPWIVPDFSVETHLPYLDQLQARLDRGESLTFTAKRFLIHATKEIN